VPGNFWDVTSDSGGVVAHTLRTLVLVRNLISIEKYLNKEDLDLLFLATLFHDAWMKGEGEEALPGPDEWPFHHIAAAHYLHEEHRKYEEEFGFFIPGHRLYRVLRAIEQHEGQLTRIPTNIYTEYGRDTIPLDEDPI